MRGFRQIDPKGIVTVDKQTFLKDLQQPIKAKQAVPLVKEAKDKKSPIKQERKEPKEPKDPRLKKYFSFLNRLCTAAELPNISKQHTFYRYNIGDQYRCQDIFDGLSNIENIPGIKDEHLEIGRRFQTMKKNCSSWKSLRVKSSKTSDQIFVVATFTSDGNTGTVEAQRDCLLQNMSKMCTSLFMTTITAKSMEAKKVAKVYQLMGPDYLEETIGFFKFKLGPFAQMPVSPQGFVDSFRNVQNACIRPDDVVIDFDCSAGIYGVNMASSKYFKSGLMGFDASPVNVANATLNAQEKGLPSIDIRHGGSVKDLEQGLVDLHFENRKAVVLLHPHADSSISEPIIRVLKHSHVVKSIIYFTSNPAQGFFNFAELLKADSKKDRLRCFQFVKCHVLDVYPNSSNFEHVFVFQNKQLMN